MKINIPDFCLVLMVGASASGKSTLANRLFYPHEVVSSDHCRAMVTNDPSDQSANDEVFDLMHTIVRKRLQRGLLTVADATNLKPRDRREFLQIARDTDCSTVAITLNIPEHICQERNAQRQDRQTPPRVIARHTRDTAASLKQMRRERIREVHVISSTYDQDAITVERQRSPSNLKHLTGPFDIIGDPHGCAAELQELLAKLGYLPHNDAEHGDTLRHPQGRTAIFLGDLVDRGPDSPGVLDTVMAMTQSGDALCVTGNHDNKLVRKLRGNPVQMTHGLPQTMEQLENVPEEKTEQYRKFLNGLRHHYILDNGNLAVAHAGIIEPYQGRSSGRVRNFCLYGETNGETDQYGLPQRHDWAQEYRGQASVVYGHVPTTNPQWLNNTICVDTGCVYGGQLTAVRYPEKDLVQVQAHAVHYQPERPADTSPEPSPGTPAHQPSHISIEDLTGQKSIWTMSTGRVRINPDQAAAAVETMSRFALDPRWLPYLPATISPCDTSPLQDHLEHPDQALGYYASQKQPTVTCQEKHMGSRAIIAVARTPQKLSEVFRIPSKLQGQCYTRNGRPFFTDTTMLQQLLTRMNQALETSGVYEELDTGWLLMDAEIMPWSLKATELINRHFAPIAATGLHTLPHTARLLDQAQARGIDTGDRALDIKRRAEALTKYHAAYSQYSWEVDDITDIKIAPFHILASEGMAQTGNDHPWHMAIADRLAQADPDIFRATANITLDPADDADRARALKFWNGLTAAGGEGMVVKPTTFIPPKGVQPAIKCRGREYLRIIYGPEYDLPQNLPHLKNRRTQGKRRMASTQFALGIEALKRFADGEPPHRYHQCVFAIMALDAEPMDPRL